jgi:23S rRNA (guanine745-N1)-methyltransferase
MPLECFRLFVVCPICDADLTRSGNTIACANRHTFDVAREGYVNLEGARGRAPRTPGDTREMLLARRHFLERGFYQPLSDAINRVVGAHLAAMGDKGAPAGILDAGCGEGYYLARLKQHLDVELARPICYVGSDVSREAVRLAARSHRDLSFAVASTTGRLPFRSIDVLLDVFAPRNPAEFHRVTTPEALLLIVIPTDRHLVEAREALHLLGIQEEKQRRVVEQFADPFRLVGVERIEYGMDLSREDLADLVLMGPSAWHRTAAPDERLVQVPALRVTTSFEVLTFDRVS